MLNLPLRFIALTMINVHVRLKWHRLPACDSRSLRLTVTIVLLLVAPASAQTELPVDTRIVGYSRFVEFPGTKRISLTFDGTQAVVFWERGKASLFNVDDLTETPLKVDPHCVGLRSNSQQDG